MKLKLTNFSLRFPWIIVLLVLIAVIFGTAQFPKVQFDNDPENMLAPDEPVRVFHNQNKANYALYDMVIVGVVNTNNPDGVFNVDTLGRIDVLTKQLLSLRQNADGLPEITVPHPFTPDLQPESARKRILSEIFGNDVNHLFDDDGNSAIVKAELISPAVVDNIKQAEHGALKIEYLMEQPPATRDEALTIRDDAMNNPLYKGTLVSEDEKAIAIYIPIIGKIRAHRGFRPSPRFAVPFSHCLNHSRWSLFDFVKLCLRLAPTRKLKPRFASADRLRLPRIGKKSRHTMAARLRRGHGGGPIAGPADEF